MNLHSFLFHNNLYKRQVGTLQRDCNPLQLGGFSESTIYRHICKIEHYPNIWGGDITFAYGKMGITKNQYWSFQKEWRYILHVFPFSLENWAAIIQNNSLTLSILHNIADGIIRCPLQHYDLKLSQEALDNMEIKTGPLLTKEKEDEIYGLANDISKSIKICKSSLSGKIRA